MKKLQTGISTNMDFIKAMKEKGQDVNAEFPAETLRKQFDEISDADITMNMTNETFLEEVANGEEPTPVEEITVTITVDGLDEGDNAYGAIGDEAITKFPAEITRNKNTVETLEVTCEGYETHIEEVTFNETKTINVTLEKEPISYVVTFDFNGGELDGETSWLEDVQEGSYEPTAFFEHNILSDDNFEIPEGKQFGGLTTVKDDASTLVDDSSFEVTDDIELFVFWETRMCTVTVDFAGGTGPDGETSMVNDIPYGTELHESDFPSGDITPPEGKVYGILSTDLSDPEAEFEQITITDDITVYIVWDDIIPVLTIDLNGGTYNGESFIANDYTYGETWAPTEFEDNYLSDVTLPHHKMYAGISTVKDDDTTLIDGSITLTEDTTVYLYLETEQN